jgi:predicted GNAT family N-acyltransferase
VLRLPLGMDFTDEQLAAENEETHFGVWVAEDAADHCAEVEEAPGRLVACALIQWPEADYAKVRQVAVNPDVQGQGYGRLVMTACEEEARRRNARRVMLHAREVAVPFYLALGYHIEGEPFTEIGIPHRRMVREL